MSLTYILTGLVILCILTAIAIRQYWKFVASQVCVEYEMKYKDKVVREKEYFDKEHFDALIDRYFVAWQRQQYEIHNLYLSREEEIQFSYRILP